MDYPIKGIKEFPLYTLTVPRNISTGTLRQIQRALSQMQTVRSDGKRTQYLIVPEGHSLSVINLRELYKETWRRTKQIIHTYWQWYFIVRPPQIYMQTKRWLHKQKLDMEAL